MTSVTAWYVDDSLIYSKVTCFGHVKLSSMQSVYILESVQRVHIPHPKGGPKPFQRPNKGTLILEWNE